MSEFLPSERDHKGVEKGAAKYGQPVPERETGKHIERKPPLKNEGEAPASGNVDSAELGYEQPMKTTTKKREEAENDGYKYDCQCGHGKGSHSDGKNQCNLCDCQSVVMENHEGNPGPIMDNGDPKAEAEEIARHAEGIKHEVEELLENGDTSIERSVGGSWDRASKDRRVGMLFIVGISSETAEKMRNLNWSSLDSSLKRALVEGAQSGKLSLDNASDEECEGCGNAFPVADMKDINGQGPYCPACYRSGMEMLTNQGPSGKSGTKPFVFVDVHGEEVRVDATSEEAAWEKLAADYATPVSDIKGLGIHLKNSGICRECGHSSDSHSQGTSVSFHSGARCEQPGCKCVEPYHLANAIVPAGSPCPGCGKKVTPGDDGKGRIFSCRRCGKKVCSECDKGDDEPLCPSCSRRNTSVDDMAKDPGHGEFSNEEMCPSCNLPKRMYRPEEPEKKLCGNRQCKDFKNSPDGTFTEPEKAEEDELLEGPYTRQNAKTEYAVVKVPQGWEVTKNGSKSGEIFEDEREAKDRAKYLNHFYGDDLQNDTRINRLILRDGVDAGNERYGKKENAAKQFKPGDMVTVVLSDGNKEAKFVKYDTNYGDGDEVVTVEQRAVIGGQLFKKNEQYQEHQLRKA